MPSSPSPSSSSSNININNYPIGLIHLTCISPSSSSSPPSEHPFTLTTINTFALSLLHLPSNPSFTLFKQSILSFNSSSLTDNNTPETKYTLYDVIVSPKPFLCSNFVHSNSNQIIHVKLKRSEHNIHIVLDDYDDNRANIQEKMISSIPKQHLITISHELKNYFCGVLTSLEDSKTNLEETQLLYLSSCIDLIKKFIKIFILYVQVCLDNNNIHSNSKVFSNLDFFSTFNNAFDKARVIYKYKHINVDLSKNTPSFQVSTEFHYFKNFIKNVFIYMYYISPNNAQIGISVTKDQSSGVICECAFAHNQQSQGLFVKQCAYKMLDTSDKMNDPDVKQSVLTVPLLEYILEKLAKCLNIDIQFKKNINNNINNNSNNCSNKDVFLHIVFHKVIFDDACINTNNILLVTTCNQQNNAIWRLNNMCNSNSNNSGNNDNTNKDNDNKGSVIMFPYERKNTMERARMSMDNVRHGLHGNNKLAMSIEPISSSKFNGLSTRGKFGNGAAKSSFCEWDKDNSQVNINNNSCNNSNIKINNCINNNNNSNTSNNNNHIQQNSLFSKNKMKSSNNFRKFNLSIDSSENDNNNNNNNSLQNQFHSFHNKHQDDSLNHDNNNNNNNNNNNKVDTTNSNDHNSQSNTLILGTLYQGLPGTNGTVNPLITTSIRKRIHLIEEYSNIKLKNYLRPPPCECKDIALVDDENFIINSVSSMIRSQKLKCDCFSDGKYCYEKILEKAKCNCKRKYYKLILMDIYMHEWSGIKTCEKIGELIQQDIIPKTINVVLISAHKEKDLNLPNYDFIKGFYQKPVCKKTIVSILNEFYL